MNSCIDCIEISTYMVRYVAVTVHFGGLSKSTRIHPDAGQMLQISVPSESNIFAGSELRGGSHRDTYMGQRAVPCKQRVAREALMIVIAQKAVQRRRVRNVGCRQNCNCTLRRDLIHNHCTFCSKMFRDPEHVYKHYCLKHPDQMPNVVSQLLL